MWIRVFRNKDFTSYIRRTQRIKLSVSTFFTSVYILINTVISTPKFKRRFCYNHFTVANILNISPNIFN